MGSAKYKTQQQLIGPFSQIVTLSDLPLKGPLRDQDLIVIPDGGVVTESGDITAVGKYSSLKRRYPGAGLSYNKEVSNSSVLLPGFIDAHTHICFAGSRARDYGLRLEGKTYLEIAGAGGGIADTVKATRGATNEDLHLLLEHRLGLLLAAGVTTVEVKTGYGLSIDAELRLLRLLKQVQEKADIDMVITCLAAHMKPFDFKGSKEAYLNHLIKDLFPMIEREQLCTRIDAFVEQTAFSVKEARSYLQKAKDYGWDVTIHADQFTAGGAQLAVDIGAVSADHLEASTQAGIQALAGSSTVATVLPGASIGLGMHFAPARRLLDAGCCVAIASDWNPGSAPMGNLLTQAAILGAYEKLSIAETLAGLTCRAAQALALTGLGKIEAGCMADFQAYAVNDYREIFYHQGQIKPATVWKKGVRYDQ